MEVYKYDIDKSLNTSKYFTEENICFLDIETTGLSRKYNQIYLIGIIYYEENKGWKLMQFFANDLEEEKIMLENFNKVIVDFDLIVNYNGNTFDLPFIESKMKYYGIKSNMKNINSFDIYREVRKNQGYLELNNLKLKTIEESLGIYRDDIYSGKDCIEFYFQYVKTKDEVLRENILRHNYDDLYYLFDILEVFDVLKNIKSFKVKLNDDTLYIEILEIIVVENILRINCKTEQKIEIDIIHYDENFNLNWKSEGSLSIDLNVKEGFITPTKKCLFINKEAIPIDGDLKDLSQYRVPNNLILLKVEKTFIVENIKSVIKNLVLYVL